MSIARLLGKYPVGKPFIFLYRTFIATKQSAKQLGIILKWLIHSNETTNYTYEITRLNKIYLANFIASNFKIDIREVIKYLKEVEGDTKLKKHIKRSHKESSKKNMSDKKAKYARRIGWYAMIRIIKPKVVVETGVDKGLGSCIIASALEKNSKEGYPGKYYGTDINPLAGELFSSGYSKFGKVIYGDSIESLKNIKEKIDLFINDSDHSSNYEEREYETIKEKLSKKGVILGDNSHVTDKLFNFSMKNNRKFSMFYEIPENHWIRGCGIGVSQAK